MNKAIIIASLISIVVTLSIVILLDNQIEESKIYIKDQFAHPCQKWALEYVNVYKESLELTKAGLEYNSTEYLNISESLGKRALEIESHNDECVDLETGKYHKEWYTEEFQEKLKDIRNEIQMGNLVE